MLDFIVPLYPSVSIQTLKCKQGQGERVVEKEMRIVVVPKEEAVFWMDRFGHWYNEGGRLRHKKIVDYFNAAICRDRDGYFVQQVRDDIVEKVYFRYEDTPLFVVDATAEDPVRLRLNTRETLALETEQLFIQGDSLYLQRGEDRIKFSDRALLKLAGRIGYNEAQGYELLTPAGNCPIPQRP